MKPATSPLGIFERYLSVWVALAIGVGVGLGNLLPGLFSTIARLEYANVNFVVAILIWVMIYPMMIQIDFGAVRDVGRRPKGLIITLIVNWLIKPFTMAALASLFFLHVFAAWIPAAEAREYIAGAILLGVAPCTAMVFVWSQLTRGDANYTLVQVAVNDLVMVVAFAPLTALLLGVSDIIVPWTTLLLSVALYVVIPLLAGVATRRCSTSSQRSRLPRRGSRSLPGWAAASTTAVSGSPATTKRSTATPAASSATSAAADHGARSNDVPPVTRKARRPWRAAAAPTSGSTPRPKRIAVACWKPQRSGPVTNAPGRRRSSARRRAARP